MIPSKTPSLFPETPVLRVNDQAFEIRFLAQADEIPAHEDHDDHAGDHDEHAADAHATDAHTDDAHADDAAAHASGHEEHAADGEHAEAHVEHHGKDKYKVPKELPNIYTLTTAFFAKDDGHHGDDHHHKPWWVNPSFSMFYALLLVVIVTRITRRLSVDKPGKPQVALEGLFNGLANFFGEIVGPENIRKYVPFLGSLWLFILINNYFALIPFFKSPTAYFETTVGLGICVFIYVNYHGMKAGGVGHYFWHLCGSPSNAVGWIMAPLMFVLEAVGTFVKPISLSLRLYGNIFGEDKLLAIFLGLGMSIFAILLDSPTPVVGIPLHLPFLFLSVLLGTIQATVFAMLSAVYIALLLPHHDHEHEHDEAHAPHGEEAHSGHA